VVSSIFPQLPAQSRSRFRAGLIVLVVALAGFALLRWQAPMIAVATFGLPILFVLYLREIDGGRAQPVRGVIVATVLGLGLGVVWALAVGPILAGAYNASVSGQTDVAKVLLSGVAIPVGASVLMFVPALVVRLLDRSNRGIFAGFAVGALSATVFNAAATVTLLLPQLAMGVRSKPREQSVVTLLAEAAVEGLAWPLLSLATGGIVGIALWFTLPTNAFRYHRGAILSAFAVVLVVLTAMWVIDVAPLPLSLYSALQLLVVAASVIALRIVIAAAVHHEARSDTGGASSPARTATYPGVLGPLIAGLGVAVAAAVGIAVLITPAPKPYACPPNCARPPLGTPAETNPRFSGDNGEFSVSYPGEGSVYQTIFDPPGRNGVESTYLAGDTGTLTFFGEPAQGRNARQIVGQLIDSEYNGASVAYEIPNASVGYQPGYGVVADVYLRGPLASYSRRRVIVIAAIKYDYALVATAEGPYHQFSPDYGNGQPSGANLELALDMGKYVNSFRWNGDRYGGRS